MLVFLAFLPQNSLKFPAFLAHAHLLLAGISKKKFSSCSAVQVGHTVILCNCNPENLVSKIQSGG